MTLSRALRLHNETCVAFVGAGGKTTALFQLARELALSCKAVIVTATTHMHIDQINYADSHWVIVEPGELDAFQKNLSGVMLVTGPQEGDRTLGVNVEILSRLHEVQEHHHLPLLIEADGSRQKPLKAPAQYEPVIPEFVEMVVVVAGLTGLGKPLMDQFVHRPEIFARLSGSQMGETITIEILSHVLNNPSGGLQNIPRQAHRIAFLNQADTAELKADGKTLAKKLLPTFHSVIIGSLENAHIHAVYEPVAGIVLAGGGSSRYGQPKQILDWHGIPFVRAVAETALTAGLSPVIVVTGANSEMVNSALVNMPVKIVHNPAWQNGQSTSIQAGLHFLTSPFSRSSTSKIEEIGSGWEAVGAAIFLLVDQPQITPTILGALCEEHSRSLSPIVAPLVAGQRANPVMFDRTTFPDLMALTGDVGGRGIFNKISVKYLPWQDESLLTDVDSPDEYGKLLDAE